MNLLEIIREINKVLHAHNVIESISASDISVNNKSISDIPRDPAKLSNAVVESVWPQINEQEVYHYTSKAAAESIVKTNSFRLYTLLKRFTDDEVKTFCEIHNLDGYLSIQSGGEPYYKSRILPRLFYSSFTDTNVTTAQEQNFWNSFSGPNGARLRFRIKAMNPNFRKIVYATIQNKPVALIRDLSDIAHRYNREFIFQGISRFCAFYLSSVYKIENEYRIIYKQFNGFEPDIRNDGNYTYIEVPLQNQNDTGYEIELLEIQTVDGTFDIPTSLPISRRP